MTPPTCERCNGIGEPTEDSGEWLCPRCGIWIAIDGAELGPKITPEQAMARYEAFAIKSAARIMEEAKRLGITPPEPPTEAQTRVAKFDKIVTDSAVRLMEEAEMHLLENPKCGHAYGFLFSEDAIRCAACGERVSTSAPTRDE